VLREASALEELPSAETLVSSELRIQGALSMD